MKDEKEEFVDAKQEQDVIDKPINDVDDDVDDTASFVSAIDDTQSLEQQTNKVDNNPQQVDLTKEEIPQDITREELYLLRNALSETYRIKKIEAIEKARKTLYERFSARLVSGEVDKLLDEYIRLKQAKKEAELKEDVNSQVEIKSQMGNLESKMILSVEEKNIRKMCKDNIKEYDEKYDRMWDMWLERYDKVKYDPPKKLGDSTRIKKFIEDNGLYLPQKRNRKNKKMDAVIEEFFPTTVASRRKSFITRVLSSLLYIPVRIKNGIVRMLKMLFNKDKQQRKIEKEIRNIEKKMAKGGRDDLLARRNDLIKLKYKYKIFKSEIQENPYLKKGFENSIRLSLDTIKQATVAMNNVKKSLKLKQESGDITQTNDEILKTAKMLSKLNSIDKEKKYNEEISRLK